MQPLYNSGGQFRIVKFCHAFVYPLYNSEEAKLQDKKVKVMGCTRLAIFAGKDMPVGTEMTIDYGMTSMKSDFSLQQPFRWYHRRHLKPLFKMGENVYSAFWQNAKRNDNPQWFPGTMKDAK